MVFPAPVVPPGSGHGLTLVPGCGLYADQRVAAGTLGADKLEALRRAHANTAEFAPMLCVLMLYISWRTHTNPNMFLNLCSVVVTVARVSAAVRPPSAQQHSPPALCL